jgi:hypothetical protein
MANWERKSSYLLREIVKFRTYIDSLTASQALKTKIYAEREAAESNNAGAGSNEPAKLVKPASTTETSDGGNEAPASAPQPITA